MSFASLITLQAPLTMFKNEFSLFSRISLKQYYFSSITSCLRCVAERMAETRFADLQPRTSQRSSELAEQQPSSSRGVGDTGARGAQPTATNKSATGRSRAKQTPRLATKESSHRVSVLL